MNEHDSETPNGKPSTQAARQEINGAGGNGEGRAHPPLNPTEIAPAPDAFGASGRVALPPPAAEAFGDPRRQKPSDDRKQKHSKKQPADADQDQDEQDAAGQDQDEKSESDGGEGEGKKQKEKPKKPIYKRPVLMTVLLVIVLGLGIGGLLYWLHARDYESTDDAFIDGNVVTISPNVSATVLDVLVNDNWNVKQGQVIVKLDPRDYQAVRDQKQAAYEAAEGQYDESQAMVQVDQANLDEAKAGVEVAQANAANALQDFNRISHLNAEARSQQQLDQATANEKSDQAQVDQAKAKVEAAQAQVIDAQRNVKTAYDNMQTAKTEVAQADINLGYCTIVAPEDGRVTRKSVQPGSYVSTGQALMSIVPTDVWVTANYKETQLDLIRPGQPVTIHIDAYPEKDLLGKVDSIQNGSGAEFSLLPPENATGNYVKVVQRVPVKIVFLDGQITGFEHLLAPGLSVEPYIQIRQ